MRTTLDIDEDVLQAAKEHAARERKSLGAVISGLARESLRRPAAAVDPGPGHRGARVGAFVGVGVLEESRDAAGEEAFDAVEWPLGRSCFG